jgi:hypothetical protein
MLWSLKRVAIVNKFANQKNGCQAWRTLHDHFFGGDKVNTMVADVLSTLNALHYSGDQRKTSNALPT